MTSESNIKRISMFSILFVFSIIFLRPTLWGQSLTFPGLIALFILLIFFVSKFRTAPHSIERWFIILTFSIILFWLYCVSAAVIIGDSDIEFVFKAAGAGIFTSLTYFFILSDSGLNKIIFKYFAILNSCLGWSIVATTILMIFFGYDFLTYYHLAIKGYEAGLTNGDVLFPFSPVYGTLLEYDIYRYLGIYRESGIAQLFFIWSATYLFFSKEKLIYIIGALIGGVLTASTSVVFSLGLVLLGYFYWDKKVSIKTLLLILIVIISFALLLIYFPGLGLLDKRETHFDSIDDRSYAMSFVYSEFSSLFIGTGLYNMNAPYENIGINAVSSIYFIGIVGFILYVSQFFVYQFLAPAGVRGRYITLLFPLLVTSLLFQPLIDAPLACMLLYCIPPEM